MKSKRTKALSIPKSVKITVNKRDESTCVLCGTHCEVEFSCCHYVSRANGGLGIEENIVTLCDGCHRALDQSIRRKILLVKIKSHLEWFYPGFKDEDRKYKKGE
jgi:5-methylcytosine-specific restriction endonuclease McrA